MTPTTRRRSLPSNLEALVEARPDQLLYRFERDRGSRELTAAALLDQAMRVAALLGDAGARPGDRVLVVCPHEPEYLVGVWACLLSGIVAVPLNPPYTTGQRARLRTIARASSATAALTVEDTMRDGRADTGVRTLLIGHAAGLPVDGVRRRAAPEDPALLQYTSGSTASPKGVLVSHANLSANQDMVRAAFGVREDSTIVSWLPFFHDMGFMTALQVVHAGCRGVLLSPRRFLKDPGTWLRTIARHGADISGGPNFAYELCLHRVLASSASDLDLSCWTTAYNGSERVRPDTMRRFAEAFAPAGFRHSAFRPCYGLAEATLLVSASVPGREPLTTAVARGAGGQGYEVASCGVPAHETTVNIVDPRSGSPLPEESIGEICVRGPQVAHGYWREQGAEPFPHLEEHGLRTGDLGFLSNGELFVTGRHKDLIILRGVNHFPDDLEYTASRVTAATGRTAAFEIEGPREACAVLLQEVQRGTEAARLAELLAVVRGALSEEHGIASCVIGLLPKGALPLTTSGKVRRGECRALYLDGRMPLLAEDRGHQWSEPSSDVEDDDVEHSEAVETVVLRVLRQVLGVDPSQVELAQPLARLGMDSLRATEIRARIEQALGVRVPIREVLEGTPARLIEEARTQNQNPTSADDDPATSSGGELLPQQTAFWLFQQREPQSAAYNEFVGFALPGSVDAAEMRSAWESIVLRHASLRSRFVQRGHDVVREVVPNAPFDWDTIDASEWDDAMVDQALADEAHRPFAPCAGPLVRARLYLRSTGGVLLLVAHHLVCDLLSLRVLLSELNQRAQGQLLPPAARPAAFVAWRRALQKPAPLFPEGDARELELEWSLPGDHSRPATLTRKVDGVCRPVDRALLDAMSERLARGEGTPASMFLTAFLVALARCSSSDAVTVGVPFSGRTDPRWAQLVAPCIHYLPIGTSVSPERTFDQLLTDVTGQLRTGLDRQDQVPARPRLGTIPVAFIHHPRVAVPGLEPLVIERRESAFDLCLTVEETAEGAELRVEYCRDTYERSTINRVLRVVVHALRTLTSEPGTFVLAPSIIEDAETARILDEWNGASRRAATPLFHELIVEAASKTPDRPAAELGNRVLTYRELESTSATVAAGLAHAGLPAGSLIAMWLRPEPLVLTAMLGILRAGMAFVPVSPDDPRASGLVRASGCRAVLTTRELSPAVPGIPVITLEDLRREDHGPLPPVDGADLAYVVFTSGTTGVPKGVRVQHHSLANVCQAWRACHAWPEAGGRTTLRGRYLQAASPTFDAFIADVGRALCNSGTLVFCPPETLSDPAALHAFAIERRIEVMDLVPSLVRPLLAHLESTGGDLRFLELAVVGSDAWYGHELVRLRELCGPDTRVIGNYGVTEASVDNLYFDGDIDRRDLGRLVPAGRPMPNIRAYVLDPSMRLLPPQVPGELCLGGGCPADGYVGDDTRSAGRFVEWTRPDGVRERVFRTGDRARWRHDGVVELLGRLDDQLKINGIRFDPAEIEGVLGSLPGIESVAVVTRRDPRGRELLEACLCASGQRPSDAAVITHATAGLPPGLTPSRIRWLDRLPLSANGKVDRGTLAATAPLEPRPAETAGDLITDTERLVARAWCDVLGIDAAGPHDNFFALGGDSMLALRVAARLRAELSADVSIRDLFATATLRDLAGSMQQSAAPVQATPFPVPATATMSFAQKRLWFIDWLEPGSSAHNMPAVFRLTGEVSATRLRAALDRLIERHEVLRVRFVLQGDHPEVREAERQLAQLREEDLSRWPPEERAQHLELLVAKEARAPFDLEAGPLVRSMLIKTDVREHYLIVCLHHIAGDLPSIGTLMEELSVLYRAGTAEALPPVEVSYSAYAQWQARRLQEGELAAQEHYWVQTFSDAPAILRLPVDAERGSAGARPGALEALELPRALHKAIEGMARRSNTTLFVVLAAAFNALCYRYTGRSDLVVGTPVTGRTLPELESLVGLTANLVLMRADLSGNPRFEELVTRTHAAATNAIANSDVPFERITESLRSAGLQMHGDPVQVVFAVETDPLPCPRLEGVIAEPVPVDNGGAKFDFFLAVIANEERFALTVEYDRDLMTRERVSRMLGHLERILVHCAAHPSVRLDDLEMLTDTEREQIEVWNGPRVAASTTFPAELERQVAETPERIAAICGATTLSYRELNERANHLAHELIASGVSADSLVAVVANRGSSLLTAIIGVLKAGGGFLLIDPRGPSARAVSLLARTRPLVLLAQDQHAEHAATLAREAAAAPRLVVLGGSAGQVHLSNPRVTVPDNSLACMFFTSGSTGEAKGAVIEHRGLMNHLWAKVEVLGLASGDRVAQNAPATFDICVWQMLAPLLVGGATVVQDDDVASEPSALLDDADTRGVTVLETVPSMLRAMLDCVESRAADARPRLSRLRWLISNAEALDLDLCDRWFSVYPRIGLWNTYGATECSDDTSHVDVRESSARTASLVPLGHPHRNVRMYVLDASLNVLPVGIDGEIGIAGEQVGRGYVADPARTAAAFVPDPFSPVPGARLYLTGDIGRYAADGMIHFRGRRDDQVKVRGQRVALSAVESALRSLESVEDAAVVLRAMPPLAGRLVAYIVTSRAPLPVAEWLDILRKQLAAHMIPSCFIALPKLPITAHGKVDRRRLPAPEMSAERSTQGVRGDALEEWLATIFSEVLEHSPVGRDDDFFLLGGHSLLAARVAARISSAFNVSIPLRAVFESPSPRVLARAIRDSSGEGVLGSAVPSLGLREARASYGQQRLWFLQQLAPDNASYHVTVAMKLQGSLDVTALGASLDLLIARHAALRVRFEARDGELWQIVEPATPQRLACLDLRDAAPDERARELALARQACATEPFDLAAGPLIRCRLVRLGETAHELLLGLHHVVVDGWSETILIRELALLYAAQTQGEAGVLPALPVDYLDYAQWQRQWVQTPAGTEAANYWRAQLAGELPRLALGGRSDGVVRSGGVVRRALAPASSAELMQLGRANGATPFMTLLAGWATLLWRASGQAELLIGTPVANRSRVELEPVVGFVVNTLVLRLRDEPGMTFRDALAHVRAVTLAAFRHPEHPFDALVEQLTPRRAGRRQPLFDVMFVFQDELPAPSHLGPDLSVTMEGLPNGTAKFPLTLTIVRDAEELEAMLEFDTSRWSRPTAERLLRGYEVLLAALSAEPDRALVDIATPPGLEESANVHQRGHVPVESSANDTLHARFEEHARLRPRAVALTLGARRMRYGELNEAANRLAHLLRKRDVGPGSRVAVQLEASFELVVALLAILKAGAAYVPFDAREPAARLERSLADVRPTLLIGPTPRASTPSLTLDDIASLTPGESPDNPSVTTHADDLAYLIFTSGSSGTPKGVAVAHRQVLRLFEACASFGFDSGDTWTLFHSPAFDFSVWEMWGAFIHGARLVVVPYEAARIPGEFLALLEREHVTVLSQTPTAFRELERWDDAHRDHELDMLRLIVFGGEGLPAAPVRRWFERRGDSAPMLVNMYGITETTVHVTMHVVRGAELESWGVPIGRPLPGQEIYLLDHRLQPVADGAAGEIWVAGTGVSVGYWNRPALTAERFMPNPFGPAGSRMYRSGDIARREADGVLQHLGRADRQVKLRGFRIEPGEIEHCITAHPAVGDVAVVPRAQATDDEPALVAYVVPAPGAYADEEPLRAFTRERLPEYAVPAAFVVVPSIPRNANGKLDLGALAKEPTGGERTAAREPRTETERTLAAIFSEVLERSPIGRMQDFVELGGHSILAIKLVSRIHASFDIDLPVGEVFDSPTVAALADIVDRYRERAQHDARARIMAELEELSDEEAAQLLEQERGEDPEQG